MKTSFPQLLEKDYSVTIHQGNLQTLAIEIFKLHSNIAPEIVKVVFEIKNGQYNFQRSDVCLEHSDANTVLYGT